MQDSFGPTGPEGVFSNGLQTAMRTLRGNRDTLLSVLEPFLKDLRESVAAAGESRGVEARYS